jgi:hypothetical protein
MQLTLAENGRNSIVIKFQAPPCWIRTRRSVGSINNQIVQLMRPCWGLRNLVAENGRNPIVTRFRAHLCWIRTRKSVGSTKTAIAQGPHQCWCHPALVAVQEIQEIAAIRSWMQLRKPVETELLLIAMTQTTRNLMQRQRPVSQLYLAP